jgi:hypothetical protein
MEPYLDLATHCARIDRRTTRYQFDLERDIEWSRWGEPGRCVPDGVLESLGLIWRSPPTEEIRSLLDLATAYRLAEAFIDSERYGVVFIQSGLSASERGRSAALLAEEELKHIAMFRRIQGLIRSQVEARFPSAAAAALEGPSPLPETFHHLDALSPAELHFINWLSLLIIEEYSIHFFDCLAGAEAIQPCWLSLHAAHQREEKQHLVTDLAHLRAIHLDAGRQAELTRRFLAWLIAVTPARLFGLRMGWEVVKSAFPEARGTVAWRPSSDVPVLSEGGVRSVFRFTHRLVPQLDAMLGELVRPERRT